MSTVNVRTLTGRVVSNKMDCSIVVEIQRRVKHPLYKKYINKYTKVMAHDAENACQMGDIVTVRECRPISKHKSWMLVNVHHKEESSS